MYLYGASGHGRVVAEIAELNRWRVEGFIDVDPSKRHLMHHPVSHDIPPGSIEVIISLGDNATRKKIVSNHKNFTYPAALTHPGASISGSALLGKGTVVMAGVSINSGAKIGAHCIVNTNASVDHECIIEDFVHVSPNAALAGNVTVKEGAHIGIGACIIQGVTIGKWCTIGAGAVIIRDVPDGVTVVGNPGRIIN